MPKAVAMTMTVEHFWTFMAFATIAAMLIWF